LGKVAIRGNILANLAVLPIESTSTTVESELETRTLTKLAALQTLKEDQK